MHDAKYMEIFRTLRGEILAGKYDNALHLPSENQLVRRFGASRSTMIRVMLELQKYGLVERRRGSSTCIALPDDADAVRRIFRRGSPPDAFICGNDRTAARLLQTLSAIGKRVPNDVMLAGFDDVSCAQLLSPPLTTMRQPCEDIAAVAVRTLLERIGNHALPPREISLEATLVVRESTKGQV